VLAFLVASAAMAADLPKPTGEAIVDPEAKLELLFTRSAPIQGGLTEGCALAPDGSIYFSDIPVGADKGQILRFDPKTKKTTVSATTAASRQAALRRQGPSSGLRGDQAALSPLDVERAAHRGCGQVQG
jgi:streptogramin lyase